MNQREIDLKDIANELAIWETRIANLNTINLNDGNLLSEYSIGELLNCIYGYDLKNANALKKNHPAIDLADTKNRIAFQVTSTKTARKIQDTIDKFTANRFYETYDRLFVLVLGKKLEKYNPFKADNTLSFNSDTDIIDFRDLLKQVNYLPTAKIRAVLQILTKENQRSNSPKANAGTLLRKSLGIKKRMEKAFLKPYSREIWDVAYYEPCWKFIYDRVIVRSVEDRKFPDLDADNQGWFRMEVWDFYKYGIEFISQGRNILIDQNNNWDIPEQDDPRASNPEYQLVHLHGFLRVSFDDIEAFDMEPDAWYGYPSIFCYFRHDGQPWSEVRYGKMGTCKTKKTTAYLETNKRKKLP